MEDKKYIDFHSHTKFSDGVDDPKTLVRSMKLRGIDVMAITDHDNLLGYFQAVDEAKKWNIELIPGTEVSTTLFHILGLNVDPYNEDFNNFLAKIRDLQAKTSEKRIHLLQNYGFPISMEKLTSAFPESRLGKYNVFMKMLTDPECYEIMEKELPDSTVDQKYERYFGKNGVANDIKRKEAHAKEAIAQIHNAGGIAIVAHPFKQVKHAKDLDALVKYGLDGIEIQPFYGDKNIQFREYAKEKNLLTTFGSDYHGAAFFRPLMGRGENHKTKDELEEMLNKYKNQNVGV